MQKSNTQPNNTRFEIRPASPEEAGLFYAQLPLEDERLGTMAMSAWTSVAAEMSSGTPGGLVGRRN